MSDYFIGEIRAFPYSFAPYGWFACQGQLLAISAYTTLYAVIGTTYGGDGMSTFGLPNLAGVAIMGVGAGQGLSPRSLGEQVGTEMVTLLQTQMPQHNHTLTTQEVPGTAAPTGTTNAPTSQAWLTSIRQIVGTSTEVVPAYLPGGQFNTILHPNTVGIGGGSIPHENRQPFNVIQYCMCWNGIYPSPG